jgi:hypothetical protein
MNTLELKDPTGLKNIFETCIEKNTFKKRNIMIPIKEYFDGSNITISNDIIQYSIYVMNYRFDCIIFYFNNVVYSVFEIVFQNSSIGIWYKVVNYEHSEELENCRNCIMNQLQFKFYQIDTGLSANDIESIECPWMFEKLKEFEQKCKKTTCIHVKRYVAHIRNQISKLKYFRLKRSFQIWKEWYYNPNNLNGYILHLDKSYLNNYKV